MKTESEMRAEQAPTFNKVKELSKYIESLVDREHDYGTCVYAMSLAATAALNFVASRLGVTGFQASCADLDILRRTRRLDCPFVLIKASDELYPQYDNLKKLQECRTEWRDWIRDAAKERLSNFEAAKQPEVMGVHPVVLAHWRKLAERESE